MIVKLKDTAIKDFGIEIAQAQGGTIGTHTTLPAEITLNADAVAHIVPRLGGVVRSVSKNLGDKVRAGEVLAVIHSRELADYRAGYLGAKEKIALAQTMFEREKNLWEKKITAEQEYLNAKRDMADAQIEMRSAKQKLHALGFSQEYLETLSNQPDESFIVYEVITPIAGTIIEKHITLGEVLKDDSEPFVVADISNVWVKVNVHQKDLPTVRCSQKAVIKTEHNQGEGVVSYVSSVLEENTRTALARIVLPNEDGMWRPGTFATASIYVDQVDCKIVVTKEAIVTMENKPFVFIVKEDGFSPQEVGLGKMNGEFAEIVSGLEPGQKYVAKGAFTLKSEMTKSNEDPCGGH
ncbi:MAG: efflux RND transporter periplasmic adaptor subunit [Planctomycetota bacterium]|nr:efflux RND transporter periplasmic adaptor subunit [Planctomycetota bacterium]